MRKISTELSIKQNEHVLIESREWKGTTEIVNGLLHKSIFPFKPAKMYRMPLSQQSKDADMLPKINFQDFIKDLQLKEVGGNSSYINKLEIIIKKQVLFPPSYCFVSFWRIKKYFMVCYFELYNLLWEHQNLLRA